MKPPITPYFQDIVSEAFGSNITEHRPLTGGGNNQIYACTLQQGTRIVIKQYSPGPTPDFNRLTSEYSALQQLWQAGVRCIPQPLHQCPQHNIGIYQYIDGKRITSADITNDDIQQACHFLVQLNSMSKADLQAYPLRASDACENIADGIASLKNRLNALLRLPSSTLEYEALSTFITQRFTPVFQQTVNAIHTNKNTNNTLTLSPSDFGFHNALKTEQGKLYFLDFEYFGWDHAGKMVADFILHPGVPLSTTQQQLALDTLFSLWPVDHHLESQYSQFYPLCVLKWCLIILNDFLPGVMSKRQWGKAAATEKKTRLKQQLQKAEHYIQRLDRQGML